MSLVRVNNLERNYGDHCAVDNISFKLKAGDILGLLGPNGAGKSTTMQMLTGNLAPSAGKIKIDGIDLLSEPKQAKSILGYLPEHPPLYRELSVDEYLGYCARLHRLSAGEIGEAVDTARQRCGLAGVGHRLIGNLSKGYQQRVGIAQAIVHTPRVIVLDEPTVGLDPIQIREIRNLIVELGREHGIILSTHILPEVQAVCNRVLIINQGKLVYESTMDELMHDASSKLYHVSFTTQVSKHQLEEMDCVEMARPTEHGYLITINTTADEFAQAAVFAQTGLERLCPHHMTLEQIFIDIAHRDEEQADDEEEPA